MAGGSFSSDWSPARGLPPASRPLALRQIRNERRPENTLIVDDHANVRRTQSEDEYAQEYLIEGVRSNATHPRPSPRRRLVPLPVNVGRNSVLLH